MNAKALKLCTVLGALSVLPTFSAHADVSNVPANPAMEDQTGNVNPGASTSEDLEARRRGWRRGWHHGWYRGRHWGYYHHRRWYGGGYQCWGFHAGRGWGWWLCD